MVDLVLTTSNGRIALSKRYGPRARIETGLGYERRIALSAREEDMTLGELAQALEFGMLDELMK